MSDLFYPTKVFRKIIDAWLDPDIRIIVNEGGTSSSKTFSSLQLLQMLCEKPRKKLVSVVSESMPHIKKGCIRDIINIQGNSYIEKLHNKTDSIFKIFNSEIEFYGADAQGKVTGPRRDILFLNEANNIPKSIFDHLEVRTKEKVIIDFNPTHEFWAHTELKGRDDVAWIHSTYRDNTELDPRIVQSIERRRGKDENWWRVYGLGLVGTLEGLIFPKFELIDEYPESVDKERIGLDFGFTNHPSVAIRCGITNDNLYLDELFYETGLTNPDICNKMEAIGLIRGVDKILADCAEPKSIAEIEKDGWFIEPCVKGKDSVNAGISKVKEFNICLTKHSLNLIKEFRNYSWMKNRITEKYMQKPIDDYNHGIDGVRYAVYDMTTGTEIGIRSL